MEYFTIEKNAVTGEIARIDWSPERIAQHEAEAAMAAVPKSITRRQCALQLLTMNYITAQEALAMAKTGEVPSTIDAVLSQAFQGDALVRAHIDFAADNYYRNNELLALMGLTSEQLDHFFITASQL